LIILCADRLIELLEKEANKGSEVNITDFLKRFTMDTIWNCAFGLDIDIQNSRENEYFTRSEEVFAKTENLHFFAYMGGV
jgi:cytochrome P450